MKKSIEERLSIINRFIENQQDYLDSCRIFLSPYEYKKMEEKFRVMEDLCVELTMKIQQEESILELMADVYKYKTNAPLSTKDMFDDLYQMLIELKRKGV